MTDSPIVIDNFLPPEVFQPFAFHAMTCGQYTPCDFTAVPEERDGSIETFGENLSDQKNLTEVMFQSLQYRRDIKAQLVSDFYIASYEVFSEIKRLLNIKHLIMIRTNCTVGQRKKHIGAYHTDLSEEHFLRDYKVAIIYLNSNNGGTQFLDGPFVQSKANRCVIAPMHMQHAGVWQTDAKLRYVMNLNYAEN